MEHDLLSTEMAREHQKWAFSTKVYGTLYPTFRFYLIVVSALVAAREALAPSFQVIVTLVPLLAVTVTVVTALDTWLKPRDKWRGFMKDRDDLAALRIRAAGTSDATALDRLNNEFAELRRRHREENVW